MLTSRQIFRYAVPARTVTKKHWLYPQNGDRIVTVDSVTSFRRVYTIRRARRVDERNSRSDDSVDTCVRVCE